jgi:hypothetical protein
MAELFLSNNSGQIDLSIRCTFANLTGGLIGPLRECQSIEPLSGFLIQDGNRDVGLCVANCALLSFKNKIDFKETCADVFLNIPSARCLNLSGNGSVYSFSNDGTFSLGSGINTNFKGLQVYGAEPTLFLKDTNPAPTHSLRFFNSETEDNLIFLICQQSTKVNISGSGDLILNSRLRDSVCISGNSVALSGFPLSNYSFTNYGNTFLQCINTISGTGCIISKGALSTGFDVDSMSVFRKCAYFCSGIDVYNNCLTTKNCISGATGYFCDIFLAKNIIYTQPSQCFRSLRVTGSSADCNVISGLTCFFNGIVNTGSSRLCDTCFSKATGVSLRVSGGNIELSGKFEMYGCMQVCRFAGQILNHVIVGDTFVSRAAGDGFSQSFQGNVCWSGNMSTTGSGIFNNICTTGTATSLNSFNGCTCLVTPNSFLCAPNIYASSLTCGQCIVGATYVSGDLGVFQTVCQRGTAITCLGASGLHIGTNCAGYIKAANVAKAWGVFSLKSGIPTLLTGYNVCRVTLPITGIAASGTTPLRYLPTGAGLTGQWNNPYVLYGLALNETVKAPFTFDLQFHPVGCFDAFGGVRTGYSSLSEMSGYLRTGFGYYSGSSGNIADLQSGIISTGFANGTSGLAASWGPLGSYGCSVQVPLFSTLVNCAGKNVSSVGNYITGNFEKITYGNSYGEIIFNLLPACTTVSRRDYYSIGNNSLNGTGTFTIFSY